MNSVNKPSPFKLAVLNSTNPEDTMLRTFGENAHAALTVKGLGNSLLGLYDKFFQGISEDALRDGLRVVIEEARCSGGDAKRDQLINLFVMAFNVRWCRGGKGAKLAFYQCMKILYEEFPMAVVELIPLIPQYGYWKDLLLLVEEVHVRPSIGTSYDALVTSVWEIYAAQLLADYEVLRTHRVAGTVPTLSFAAKYAPRKGHHMDRTLHAVSRIAEKMFPAVSKEASTADITVHMTEGDADDYDAVLIGTDGEEVVASSAPMMSSPEEDLAAPPKKRYRQIVAALTQALDVPEVKMCSHRYAELNISSIPSRCLTRNQKALANETKNGKVRCPGDTDREQCRLNLIESVMKGKLKGGQNYPHEYVEKVSSAKTTLDCLILDAQWANMRENVKEMIRKRISTNQMASAVEAGSGEAVAVPAVDKYGSLAMGNVIPLSDVSGSMSGTPLLVSIGLGILLSELANGPFRDLVMTFTGSAVWENLGDCASFTDKVKKMKRAHWEGNTNFYNAMNRIADIVRQNRLSQDEIPNLLVISDMQFDAAGGYHSRTDIAGRSNWNIAYEDVENIFDTIGREVHGKPLTPPRIIFWNVRANSVGFPVSADQKGVMLLSGYSPALMKFILSGELEQEVEVVDDRPDAKETLETEVGREDSKGGTGDDRDSDVVEVKKKKVKVQLSPAETLDKVLHEEALDPVRKVLENLPASDLAIGAGSLLRRCGAQTNRGCGGRGRGRGSVRGRRGRGRR